MPTVRKSARAVVVLGMALLLSSAAFAAPRGDDSPGHGILSRIRTLIVHVFDDIREGLPGG